MTVATETATVPIWWPGSPDAVEQAKELARELIERGIHVRLFITGSHWERPCLQLSTQPGWIPGWHEYVYAAPDDKTGEWWFWWSLPEIKAIDKLCKVSDAVDKILADLLVPQSS